MFFLFTLPVTKSNVLQSFLIFRINKLKIYTKPAFLNGHQVTEISRLWGFLKPKQNFYLKKKKLNWKYLNWKQTFNLKPLNWKQTCSRLVRMLFFFPRFILTFFKYFSHHISQSPCLRFLPHVIACQPPVTFAFYRNELKTTPNRDAAKNIT